MFTVSTLAAGLQTRRRQQSRSVGPSGLESGHGTSRTAAEVLSNLLRELVDGPPGEAAFVLNPGDPGLFASLAELSAAQASTRVNGRSSAAAHVQHLRFGLHVLNRWADGDANAFADATYAESWSHQEVNETEWRELREAFEHELPEWRSRLDPRSHWTRRR